MFVHPVSLSITPAGNDQMRVQVSYEIESSEFDIASQTIYNHRCTIENASLRGGPAARPILVRLPAEPDLLTGRPEPIVVNIDVTVDRNDLTGPDDPILAFDVDKVRAWVYVIQPVASDPVTLGELERSPGLAAARD